MIRPVCGLNSALHWLHCRRRRGSTELGLKGLCVSGIGVCCMEWHCGQDDALKNASSFTRSGVSTSWCPSNAFHTSSGFISVNAAMVDLSWHTSRINARSM